MTVPQRRILRAARNFGRVLVPNWKVKTPQSSPVSQTFDGVLVTADLNFHF